jgi:drug/metabolite transporter (DMT)-like permease
VVSSNVCPTYLVSEKMTPSLQLVPTGYGLAAVLAWGSSDFLGGFASRRANAYFLTAISHVGGLALVLALALSTHAVFPPTASVYWALLSGACGGAALSLFYGALSSGKMGLTAAIAAVVGAAIPAAVGIFVDGLPGRLALTGFALAAVGIWLIARPDEGGLSAKGLATAVICGVGFACFYIFIKQAGNISAFWGGVCSRFAALVTVAVMVLIGGHIQRMDATRVGMGLLAGMLDISGTVCFIRATQTGRLDAAVMLTSLYPAVTVILARIFLREHFTRWKLVGMLAALAAVPLIATR